jgi:hypothetical protein
LEKINVGHKTRRYILSTLFSKEGKVENPANGGSEVIPSLFKRGTG